MMMTAYTERREERRGKVERGMGSMIVVPGMNDKEAGCHG